MVAFRRCPARDTLAVALTPAWSGDAVPFPSRAEDPRSPVLPRLGTTARAAAAPRRAGLLDRAGSQGLGSAGLRARRDPERFRHLRAGLWCARARCSG